MTKNQINPNYRNSKTLPLPRSLCTLLGGDFSRTATIHREEHDKKKQVNGEEEEERAQYLRRAEKGQLLLETDAAPEPRRRRERCDAL
jgi:hypothetical protein